MKRLSLLLALLTLSVSVSCGTSSNNENSDTMVAGEVGESSAQVTETAEATLDLPEADFDGCKFRILGRADNFVYASELGAESENGDIVNDASFKRNQAVEEMLNIEIETTAKTVSEINTLVKQAVLGGDDAYDLVINASFQITQLTTEEIFCDWYDVKNVDFSKPWWSESAIRELSIANHGYLAIGDINMSNIGIVMCIFYNRTLGEQYKLDNLYEVVNNGKWTYEYFSNVVKDIHADLNGDSVMDSNDLYGFGNNIGSTLQPFVFSLGARFSTMDKNGIPELSMNNEGFIGVFEKIWALHMENEGTYADTDFQVPRTMFANSQMVFNTGAVYHSATLYRDMEDVVGILPFPKGDESIEKYYTCHDPNVTVAAIPAVASDPDRTGHIVEALAYESYNTLTPAFYETALKVKYSRDDETVKTLDLIMDGVTFDFAMLYGSSGTTNRLAQSMMILLKEESQDFASYYAKEAPAMEEYYNEIIEKYKALD